MQEENIKETHVIDASFFLAFLMPDEELKTPPDVFNKYANGIVTFTAPSILLFEVINAIAMAVKRKRIAENIARIIIKDFLSITIVYINVHGEEVFNLAVKKNLSVYDASYLWLANE